MENDTIEFTFYPAENNQENQYVSLTFEVNKGNLDEFTNMCMKFGFAIGFNYKALEECFRA